MKMRTSVVVGVVVIVCFAISAVTYAVALDRSPESILAILSALAGPAIASLFALAKTEKQDESINVIKTQTNGKMEDLHDRVASLESPPDTDNHFH